MQYFILIILTSFLRASDIKISCEKYLFNLYPDNTDISMHILKLDKQMKKDVENKWHYTIFGNKKRADIIFKNIFETQM